jgi:hypothetical protein
MMMRGPQTIVEVLRYNGMSEADIKAMIPGHQSEPPADRPMNHHLYRDFTPSWRRKAHVHPVVWLVLATFLPSVLSFAAGWALMEWVR